MPDKYENLAHDNKLWSDLTFQERASSFDFLRIAAKRPRYVEQWKKRIEDANSGWGCQMAQFWPILGLFAPCSNTPTSGKYFCYRHAMYAQSQRYTLLHRRQPRKVVA